MLPIWGLNCSSPPAFWCCSFPIRKKLETIFIQPQFGTLPTRTAGWVPMAR